ncbi:hypothetical protein AL072_22925 [Azospirillum thiophilum]|uniref:Uncharacterized protein n=1 Tax=Azospirillum thiophilum TaxID=528244 RepID=A0AAC8ZVG2_9PROT|nr:hypothetical protein AL072_22925 [Azospirillum thiophilum]
MLHTGALVLVRFPPPALGGGVFLGGRHHAALEFQGGVAAERRALAGQSLDRGGEVQPVQPAQQVDHVAVRPAAEAVEEALAVVDEEARRLLVMEGAAGLELTPGLDQPQAPGRFAELLAAVAIKLDALLKDRANFRTPRAMKDGLTDAVRSIRETLEETGYGHLLPDLTDSTDTAQPAA